MGGGLGATSLYRLNNMKILFNQLFILVFLLISCDIVSIDEVNRVNSPNNKFVAILYETNGGATTSFGYEVYVKKKTETDRSKKLVATLYGAVRSQSAYGVNLVWKSNKNLSIEYYKAKTINKVNNILNFNDDQISINVNNNIIDTLASAGGMLYNLKNNKKLNQM